MAIKGLRLVKVERKAPSIDPVDRARNKFIEGVDRQIALAKDPKYTFEDAKGNQKAPKPWWFVQGGTLYCQIKYGNRYMFDGRAVAVSDKADDSKKLQEVLGKIKAGAEAGELDKELAEISKRKSRK